MRGSRPAGRSAIAPSRPRTPTHRQLALEAARSASKISGTAAERRPRGLGVGGAAQRELALAVVAEPARLEHRRAGRARAIARVEVGARVDRGERRRRGCRARGRASSRRAGPARRRARAAAGRPARRSRARAPSATGTFSNSNVTTSTRAGEARRALRGRRSAPATMSATAAPGTASARGSSNTKRSPSGYAGERQHAAELAAAEDADAHGLLSRRPGRAVASTSAVCSARNAASASRSGGCLPREDRGREQRGVASRPARRSRACRPGMPAGICTIESSESIAAQRLRLRPARRAPAAASSPPPCPGRCAAPPAPAMMTSSPRASARRRRIRTAGPACGGRRRRALRAARRARSSMSAAWRIVSQSERRAHDDADQRFHRGIVARARPGSAVTRCLQNDS